MSGNGFKVWVEGLGERGGEVGYFSRVVSRARASWSGQEVPFRPHWMPLQRAITSVTFMPRVSELMP